MLCSAGRGSNGTAGNAARHKAKARVHAHRARTQATTATAKTHFALDHRSAVWSPFRTGGALQAPTGETDADRQEETGDSAATAHCLLLLLAHGRLQNSRLNSAASAFRARCYKIESKPQRLAVEDMNDEKRQRRLSTLSVRVHADFVDFSRLAMNVDSTKGAGPLMHDGKCHSVARP